MESQADVPIEANNLRPVNESVKEYRVIEDGALAHYLQEREIEYHYTNNVNERRRVRGDINKAKELQDEEDRRAQILTLDEQEQLKGMDEQLAEVEQKRLIEQHILEEKERKERERKDSEYAMMIKERERRRDLRQKKNDHEFAERLSKMEMTSDHSRMRSMSDEDLAQRLQEEEKIRLQRAKEKQKNMKTVVEMQDQELARYIHERDLQEAEMMARHEKQSRGKRHKMPRGEPPPGYYRGAEQEEPHARSSHHPKELVKRPGPSRPPHPSSRSRDETVPKSVEANVPDSPLSQRRHTTRQQMHTSYDEHSPRRVNSEKPRRPPPPTSSLSSDELHHRELQRRRYNDSSRTRSEDHIVTGNSGDVDDITYGSGFARLAEEEVRLRQEEEAYYRARKKNKGGDCKQQ